MSVPVESSIGISASRAFFDLDAVDRNFVVTGSRSGLHHGTIQLSLDRKTIVFLPVNPFDIAESVQVRFSARTIFGGEPSEAPLEYSFCFSTVTVARDRFYADAGSSEVSSFEAASDDAQRSGSDGTLDVPQVTVTVDDGTATPGTILLSTPGGAQPNSYLMVLDAHGNVLKSKLVPPGPGLLFCMQPNGQYTYLPSGSGGFLGLDSEFNVVDTFNSANNYLPDGHELLVHPDGSYCILADSRSTRGELGLTGGDATSVVIGNVIQAFDRTHVKTFEWRGIDHFKVADAVHEDIALHSVDFEHTNSIDIDGDGNYLISSRGLSEITKIDGTTKQILWRLGGVHNQFQFVNDTLGLSYQHCAKWLPKISGQTLPHLIVFDNGNFHTPQESRVVEYEIDETKMTATLVWQYRHTPAIYASSMGSAFRMPNGNTFIGWGLSPQQFVAATEVNARGDVVFEMALPMNVFSYRALKYPTSSMSVADAAAPNGLFLSILPASEGYSLSFSTKEPGHASIELCDILGRTICHVFDGVTSTERQSLHLAANSFPRGMCYCLLKSGTSSLVRPLGIIR